jgi:hypothetical protein
MRDGDVGCSAAERIDRQDRIVQHHRLDFAVQQSELRLIPELPKFRRLRSNIVALGEGNFTETSGWDAGDGGDKPPADAFVTSGSTKWTAST